MTKVFKGFLAIMAGMLLMSIPSVADTIKLTGVGGNNHGGVFTVPYFLSVNHGANLTVMCDDFTHDVVIGETWPGHVYSFADIVANPTVTRGGASIANGGLGITNQTTLQKDYLEFFWLFSQFEAHPTPNNNITASDINFAAWKIFDPTLSINAGAASWLAQANSNYLTVNPNRFYIISPDDLFDGTNTVPHQNSSPQEYVGQVPEPASLALLGSGLIGLGSFIRRKLT